MVNESKKRSLAQRAKWLASGALGTVNGPLVPTRAHIARKLRHLGPIVPAPPIGGNEDAPVQLSAVRTVAAAGSHFRRIQGDESAAHVLLVWNEHQRVPANAYGVTNYGLGQFSIEVCTDPNVRLAELGRDRSLIYHYS